MVEAPQGQEIVTSVYEKGFGAIPRTLPSSRTSAGCDMERPSRRLPEGAPRGEALKPRVHFLFFG